MDGQWEAFPSCCLQWQPLASLLLRLTKSPSLSLVTWFRRRRYYPIVAFFFSTAPLSPEAFFFPVVCFRGVRDSPLLPPALVCSPGCFIPPCAFFSTSSALRLFQYLAAKRFFYVLSPDFWPLLRFKPTLLSLTTLFLAKPFWTFLLEFLLRSTSPFHGVVSPRKKGLVQKVQTKPFSCFFSGFCLHWISHILSFVMVVPVLHRPPLPTGTSPWTVFSSSPFPPLPFFTDSSSVLLKPMFSANLFSPTPLSVAASLQNHSPFSFFPRIITWYVLFPFSSSFVFFFLYSYLFTRNFLRDKYTSPWFLFFDWTCKLLATWFVPPPWGVVPPVTNCFFPLPSAGCPNTLGGPTSFFIIKL